MKNTLKRIIAYLLVVSIMVDQSLLVAADELLTTVIDHTEDEKIAADLKEAKILIGGDGVNGESYVTRNEMVTLLVRMLGKEDEALKAEINMPFTDVADWAMQYVSFAYNAGLTKGTSETTFEGTKLVDINQAATFMLRALGYPEDKYTWDKALDFMKQEKIVSEDTKLNELEFKRYTLNRLVKATLESNKYSKDITLLQALIDEGAVLQSDIDKTELKTKAEVIKEATAAGGGGGGGSAGGGGGSSSGGGGGGGTVTPTPKPEKIPDLVSLNAVKEKIIYELGEEIKLDDLVVTAIYSDESAKIVNNYTTNLEYLDLTKAGEKVLEVVYKDKKEVHAYVPFVINEPFVRQVVSLKATKLNTTYNIDDEVNDDDVTVTAQYNDNTEEPLDSSLFYTNAPMLCTAVNGSIPLTVTLGANTKINSSININVLPSEDDYEDDIEITSDDIVGGTFDKNEIIEFNIKSKKDDVRIGKVTLSIYDKNNNLLGSSRYSGNTELKKLTETERSFYGWDTRVKTDDGYDYYRYLYTKDLKIKFNTPVVDYDNVKVRFDISLYKVEDTISDYYYYYLGEYIGNKIVIEHYEMNKKQTSTGFVKQVINRLLSIFGTKDVDQTALTVKKNSVSYDIYGNDNYNSVMQDVYVGYLYHQDTIDMYQEYDFENPNSAIKYVVINDGITGIKTNAFNGYTNLLRVSIPHSIKNIETDSFKGLESLCVIKYKGDIEEWNELVKNYTNIKEDLQGVVVECNNGDVDYRLDFINKIENFKYTLDESTKELTVTGMRVDDFKKVKLASTYVIDGKTYTVTKIGRKAFADSKLSVIYLPNSIKEIDDEAFDKCIYLNYIYLGYGPGDSELETIGTYAFNFAYELKDIYYNGTVEAFNNIHEYLSRGVIMVECKNGQILKSDNTYASLKHGVLTIAGSEYTAGIGSYFNKNQITKIVIEEGIDTISNGAFSQYPNLKEVSLPSTLKNIGCNAFYNCSKLKSIDLSMEGLYIGESAFYGCSFKEMTLRADTTGNRCLRGVSVDNLNIIGNKIVCPELLYYVTANHVNIGENVRGLTGQMLDYVYMCNEFSVDSTNPLYTAHDGILYSKDMKELLAYPRYKADVIYEIPSTVENIYGSFNNEYLDKLIIGKNVDYINLCYSSLDGINLEMDDENENYKLVNGCILSKDGKKLYYAPYKDGNAYVYFDDDTASNNVDPDCFFIPYGVEETPYFDDRWASNANMIIPETLSLASSFFNHYSFTSNRGYVIYVGSSDNFDKFMNVYGVATSDNVKLINVDTEDHVLFSGVRSQYFTTKISGTIKNVTSSTIKIDGVQYDITGLSSSYNFVRGDNVTIRVNNKTNIVASVSFNSYADVEGEITAVQTTSNYIRVREDNSGIIQKYYYYNDYGTLDISRLKPGMYVRFSRYYYNDIDEIKIIKSDRDMALVSYLRKVNDKYGNTYEVQLSFGDGTISDTLTVDLESSYVELQGTNGIANGITGVTAKKEAVLNFLDSKTVSAPEKFTGFVMGYEISGDEVILKPVDETNYDYALGLIKTSRNTTSIGNYYITKNTKVIQLREYDQYKVKCNIISYENLENTNSNATFYVIGYNQETKEADMIVLSPEFIHLSEYSNFVFVKEVTDTKVEDNNGYEVTVFTLDGKEETYTYCDEDADEKIANFATIVTAGSVLDFTVANDKILSMKSHQDDPTPDPDDITIGTTDYVLVEATSTRIRLAAVEAPNGSTSENLADKVLVIKDIDDNKYELASIDDIDEYDDALAYTANDSLRIISYTDEDETAVIVIIYKDIKK